MTTLSAQIESDLIRDEGLRSRPYRDTEGFLTIGVGHNLDAEGLCRAAIMVQLAYDIRTKATDPLDRALPWWTSQPTPVRRFLANLAFNLGINGLLKWTATLALIEKGDYREAAAQFRSNRRYFTQVGPRAERLAALLDEAALGSS
jgi:lysozyme